MKLNIVNQLWKSHLESILGMHKWRAEGTFRFGSLEPSPAEPPTRQTSKRASSKPWWGNPGQCGTSRALQEARQNPPKQSLVKDHGSTPSRRTIQNNRSIPGSISRAHKIKYGFLSFLTRAQGGPGAPGSPPKALRGPSRGFRGPPGGPRDLRQTKPKNLET